MIALSEWAPGNNAKIDLALFECGYEARCASLAASLHGNFYRGLAFSNSARDGLVLAENVARYTALGVVVTSVSDDDFERVLQEMIHDSLPVGGRVFIDVSSFSRTRLAKIFSVLGSRARDFECELVIGYSLAKYSPPPKGLPVNRAIRPVHWKFDGRKADSLRPIATIVGLGYEQDKALGAVEYLQSDSNWVFVPTSPEEDYLREVLASNDTLFQLVGGHRSVEYPVLDPSYGISLIESAVRDLSKENKVVALPFGPKIFFVLCLLVSFSHEDFGVWYVSGDDNEEPVNRGPSGHFCYAKVTFSPSAA